MSDYSYQILYDYPLLVKDLDITYGGPDYKKSKKPIGRKIFFSILWYLTNNKKSTCEDIAKWIFKQDMKSERRLKSITDDVRKFIKLNLLPRRVVKEDGTIRKYNKDIQQYSLNIFGILYSIRLFEKESETKIISNLSIEYKDDLPKVFGKFPIFKKVLGENFLDLLDFRRISEEGMGIEHDLFDSSIGYYTGSRSSPIPEERCVEEITLLIYNSIFVEAFSQRFTSHHFKVKSIKKESKDKWKALFESDSETEKWYKEFLNFVVNRYDMYNRTGEHVKSMLTDFESG